MVEFFGCNSNITFRSSRYHSVLTTYLSACSRVIEIGSPKAILYYYDDKSNRGTNYCWLARSVFGFNEQHKLTITFIIALLIILQTYIIKWKLIILRLLAFDSGSLQQLTVWCGLDSLVLYWKIFNAMIHYGLIGFSPTFHASRSSWEIATSFTYAKSKFLSSLLRWLIPIKCISSRSTSIQAFKRIHTFFHEFHYKTNRLASYRGTKRTVGELHF